MSATPVIVVGGYLGAGKTTLINAFLRAPGGVRATVLVNDFGAVNIDADLIAAHEGDTIALTNGCACCSIGNDLIGAAERALESAPDVLIIEASGVAEPGRMRTLLAGVTGLGQAVALSVINAAELQIKLKDKFVGQLYRNQIAQSDFVAINRGTEGQQRAAGGFAGQCPKVAGIGELIPLAAGATGARDLAPMEESVKPGFTARRLEFAAPIPLPELKLRLATELRRAERVKGVVEVVEDGGAARKVLVNATCTQTEFAPAPREVEVGYLVVIDKGEV